jgi:CubicO group peptidase (beta-lactamase class C family)
MITARMLLTHTSSVRDRVGLWGSVSHPTPVTGYTAGDSPLALGDVLGGYLVPGGAYFIDGRCYNTYPPGSTYQYSNIGADVAAYLVESVSGTPFGQYCLDNLLTPLGMTRSGYHLADISTSDLAVPYRCDIHTREFTAFPQYGYGDFPCGCMRTSANALSIWLRCFMNRGTLDGTRILHAATVKEIMRPQLRGTEWGQGLIWYRVREAGNLLIGHNGGDYGVTTNMYFAPDRDVGVITLTNRYIGGWPAWYAFLDIQDRLLDLV